MRGFFCAVISFETLAICCETDRSNFVKVSAKQKMYYPLAFLKWRLTTLPTYVFFLLQRVLPLSLSELALPERA